MHVLAISCLVMASVTLYVAAFYFIFSLKRPQIVEHLPFALLCLSVGLYDLFCVGLYVSTSLPDGVFWQRLQFAAAVPIAVFLIWVSAVVTGTRSRKTIRFFFAWFLFLLAVTPLVPARYSLSAGVPAIKRVVLFNVFSITYYEAAAGLLYQIEIVSALCAFAYIGRLVYVRYRETGSRELGLILACQFIYFLGVLNDALVALGAYPFIYLSEYAFFFLIIAMAYVLFDRFVHLHREVEGLNIMLEQIVSERTREVEKLNDDLRHIADRDPLTGAYNRRFFNEYFDIEMKRAISNREHRSHLTGDGESMHFGLAVIDIDHFKLINDTYGHVTGDSVLMQVLAVIQENVFSRDILCRYGGDEFALILTKTSQRGVFQAAEKIRREIDEHLFVFGKGLPRQHVTISIGLVSFDELLNKGREETLKLADDRLEMAKIMGRNRIVYGGAGNAETASA